MRRVAIAVCVMAALCAAWPAAADVLHYVAGGKREGALEELTFVVGGLPRIYIRDQVASIAVNEDGKDVAKLQDGRKVEGKLGTVRFKLTEGVMAIARKEVKAVEVTAGTEVEEWKPPSDKPKKAETKPEPKLTPEQKQALAKNKELYEARMQAADELHKKDIEAFSRKNKSQWDQTVKQVESYEKRIEQKLERRRTASRRSTSESRYRNDQDRLASTDHLEQDRRDLEKERNKLSKMKKMLKDGRKQIDERGELREKRVASVARGIKSDIESGKALTEEQMTKRYEAALKIDSSKGRKKK